MYEVDRYHRVNVEGTRLAGGFAQRHGVPLVALSSRAVYGDGAPGRASHEDDPHRPVSVYGETKSLGEAALAGLDVPLTVIRPQNVVGPGQALHNPYTGVLAAFVARLREGSAAGRLRRRQPDPRLHARRRPRRAGRAGRWRTRRRTAPGSSTPGPAPAPPCSSWPRTPSRARPATRSRSSTSPSPAPATSSTPAPTSPGCARSGRPPPRGRAGTPSSPSCAGPGTGRGPGRRPGTTRSTS